MRKIVALSVIFVVITCLDARQKLNADENELKMVRKIATAWAERQIRYRSIHLIATGTTIIPKLSIAFPDFEEHYPTEDHQFTRSLDILLVLQSGKCRRNEVRELFNSSKRKFDTEVLNDLFDGKNFQEYYPREESKRLGVVRGPYEMDLVLRGESRAMFIRAVDIPLLFFLGLIPIGDFELDSPGVAFPFELASVSLRGSNEDARFVDLEIVDRLSRDRRDTYQIDVETFDVVSSSRYKKNREISRLSIDYGIFGGVRFASKWRLQIFGLVDNNPFVIEDTRMETENVVLNSEPTNSYFSIEPTPGMNVYDLLTDQRFRVPEPGGKTETIESLYFEEQRKFTPQRKFFLITSLSSLFFVLAVLYFRGRR